MLSLCPFRLRQVMCGILLLISGPAFSAGQLPVAALPGDQLVSYGFSADIDGESPIFGSVITGTFTWDFNLDGWTTSNIFLTSPPFGNPQSAPITISLTSLSAATNSDTLGLDLTLNFATALTPTHGASISDGTFQYNATGMAPPGPDLSFNVIGGQVFVVNTTSVPLPNPMFLLTAGCVTLGMTRARNSAYGRAGKSLPRRV